MPTKATDPKLRPFEVHGVEFVARSGKQAIGTCPFTGKERKFYVNTDNQLWDIKHLGLKGNLSQFLEHVSKENEDGMTPTRWKRLCEDRGLPIDAFHHWGIGHDGRRYTLPVRNYRGVVQDIRMYSLRKRFITTAGCSPGLLGSEQLSKRPAEPVYVCEGEWDAMALQWLLQRQRRAGIVLAVPGANVLKRDWAEWLEARKVYVLFDADEAGDNAEVLFAERYGPACDAIHYIHWPTAVPSGFDVRDWVLYGALKKRTPKKCLDRLLELFQDHPRKDSAQQQIKRKSAYRKPASLEKVHSVYRKWLHLAPEHEQAIEMALAVTLSNKLDGDPVWMFLVAPPGGSKTEILSPLDAHEDVLMSSSLTPHSLISGFTVTGGRDPSLIPKLNGKILLVKDFTSILGMHESDKDEIFSILRDAYDGKCSKTFGNGITRSYTSRFTVLAAVTPRIYEMTVHYQTLGERFLKFCIGDNLHHATEDEILDRAMSNVSHESEMRFELGDVVQSYLSRDTSTLLPSWPVHFRKQLIALAKFGARLRGNILRDRYRPDMILSKPSAEVGSRIVKQLSKLAMALAIVRGHKAITPYEIAMVRKVMLDTLQQRVEDVVRFIYTQTKEDRNDYVSTKEISMRTRYPYITINRLLADLNILDIVERAGKRNSFEWRLSPYIHSNILDAGLYELEEELNRPTPRAVIKLRKKRKTVRIKRRT